MTNSLRVPSGASTAAVAVSVSVDKRHEQQQQQQQQQQKQRRRRTTLSSLKSRDIDASTTTTTKTTTDRKQQRQKRPLSVTSCVVSRVVKCSSSASSSSSPHYAAFLLFCAVAFFPLSWTTLWTGRWLVVEEGGGGGGARMMLDDKEEEKGRTPGDGNFFSLDKAAVGVARSLSAESGTSSPSLSLSSSLSHSFKRNTNDSPARNGTATTLKKTTNTYPLSLVTKKKGESRRDDEDDDDDDNDSRNGSSSNNNSSSSSSSSNALPFYLIGKYDYLIPGSSPPGETRRELLARMASEPTKVIPPPRTNGGNGVDVTTWVLHAPLKHPTRNHDSVVLEDVIELEQDEDVGEGDEHAIAFRGQRRRRRRRDQTHAHDGNIALGDREDDTGATKSALEVPRPRRRRRRRRERLEVITILGRHSRYVQSLDLLTGRRRAVRTANITDPAGRPLDDLNHVSAVLVDAIPDVNENDKDDGIGGGLHGRKRANGMITTLAKPSQTKKNRTMTLTTRNWTRKEIWIPCGFHGDAVNNELSSDYARIIDVDTLSIRTGPKLPYSGGACVAAALSIVPNEPPMICAFAGTRGTHDAGVFLKETACYDRIRERWWDPFGPLPFGLDHGSLAVVPPGTCKRDDPARILIFNFRTEPYGDSHPEILARDLPTRGWTLKELMKRSDGSRRRGGKSDDEVKRKGGGGGGTNNEISSEWYLYHNFTNLSDPKNEPRDASGVVVANGGRRVLNFGGTAHRIDPQTKKRVKVRFSMIRSLDVCDKDWTIVGDLGLPTFALQSCASHTRNVAITCGGEAPLHDSNSPLCFVSRWDNVTVSDQHAAVPFRREDYIRSILSGPGVAAT